MEALGEDFDLAVAMDGESALEIVADEPPDIILLDIMMPGMDGFEVAEKLKADPATASIPIVFLSGKSDEDDRAKGMSLGAVDYITKPISPDEVLNTVQRIQEGG